MSRISTYFVPGIGQTMGSQSSSSTCYHGATGLLNPMDTSVSIRTKALRERVDPEAVIWLGDQEGFPKEGSWIEL